MLLRPGLGDDAGRHVQGLRPQLGTMSHATQRSLLDAPPPAYVEDVGDASATEYPSNAHAETSHVNLQIEPAEQQQDIAVSHHGERIQRTSMQQFRISEPLVLRKNILGLHPGIVAPLVRSATATAGFTATQLLGYGGVKAYEALSQSQGCSRSPTWLGFNSLALAGALVGLFDQSRLSRREQDIKNRENVALMRSVGIWACVGFANMYFRLAEFNAVDPANKEPACFFEIFLTAPGTSIFLGGAAIAACVVLAGTVVGAQELARRAPAVPSHLRSFISDTTRRVPEFFHNEYAAALQHDDEALVAAELGSSMVMGSARRPLQDASASLPGV